MTSEPPLSFGERLVLAAGVTALSLLAATAECLDRRDRRKRRPLISGPPATQPPRHGERAT